MDLLWTGTSFREFEVWREHYPGRVTATEQDFAQAMIDRVHRRRQRKRLAVASVIALLLAVLAVVGVSRQQAVTAARRAEASKLLALGQLELERYPTAAVAYALKSLEVADSLEARLFALEALQKGPTAFVVNECPVPAHYLDFSPDGRWPAVGGYTDVEIWPRDGGPPMSLPTVPMTATPMIPVKLSPQSDRLITSKHGEIRLFSFPELQELRIQQTEPVLMLPFAERNSFYTVSELDDGILVRSWPFDGSEPSVVGRLELEGEGKAVWGRYNVAIDPTGTWLS